jgi:transposase
VSYNFRPVEREQQYLLAPSLRDWLPDDDLAWVVLDAVEQIDLAAIYARYRADGWGAPAYDPAMMVALLLYAYALGERSSRRIETRCRRDIAYRVISANQLPDHATIARFRADHEAALGELFGQVLRLCAVAGLGTLGLVALDGTRIAAATSRKANRSADALDAEIAAMLAEAAAVDAAEDAAHGPDRHGDEPPAELAGRERRLARFREARRQLAEAQAEAEAAAPPRRRPEAPEASTDRPPGGRATTRAGRRQGWTQRNPTDPDSRLIQVVGGWLQGYNGQITVAEDGLILAAELTQAAVDYGQLGPMVHATRANLAAAEIKEPIGSLLADAGYWNEDTVAALEAAGGPRLLIAPLRPTTRLNRARFPARARMHRRLATPTGRARYRRRGAIVEPVFGQLKEARGIRRLSRRGRSACQSEWRLICMTHNLLKLWRHKRHQSAGGSPHGPTAGRPRRSRTDHGTQPARRTRSSPRRRGLD